MGVDTTRTSVTLTVLNPDYFDSPGSTIKFSTYEDSSGMVWLQQDGQANGTGLASFFGTLTLAEHTWNLQATNLRNEVD